MCTKISSNCVIFKRYRGINAYGCMYNNISKISRNLRKNYGLFLEDNCTVIRNVPLTNFTKFVEIAQKYLF